MTEGRTKGRRFGSTDTVSPLADPTPPEALDDRAPIGTAAPRPPAAVRPRAQDLISTTRTGEIAREQINGETPVVLQLRRRMMLYKLDEGVELRDQLALALDQWLNSHGY